MNRKRIICTTRLMARPSFLSGYARGLDIAGVFDRYHTSTSESAADRRALANDWKAVGDQMREALASRE